jgi:hypothetical protein
LGSWSFIRWPYGSNSTSIASWIIVINYPKSEPLILEKFVFVNSSKGSAWLLHTFSDRFIEYEADQEIQLLTAFFVWSMLSWTKIPILKLMFCIG